MKLTTSMCRLLADLEYLIAIQTWNQTSGDSIRYPVTIKIKDKEYKIQYNPLNGAYRGRLRQLTPDVISSMTYKFGANHLEIGAGLISIINELERRYNLDFNELEKQRKKQS